MHTPGCHESGVLVLWFQMEAHEMETCCENGVKNSVQHGNRGAHPFSLLR